MADEVTQFGERELQELAAIIRFYRRNGLWSPMGTSGIDDKRDGGLLIKNTESNTIPAFGCVEVTGTADETNGPNFVTVKKPTSTGTLFLFNGPYEIEANGYGRAQTGPVYRVYKNSGTVTLGNRWAPTASQYYLTKGYGAYVVMGADDIGTNVFRVMRDDVARLYRFTINESLADGTASSDILEMDGTDTGVDAVVNDPLGIFATLTATDDAGYCVYQDGKFYAIQAPCP